MKKILISLVLFAMSCCMIACSEDNDEPTLTFNRSVYVMPADAPVNVEVRISEPAKEVLTIPFNVSGSAVEGEDYEMPVKEFMIPAGSDRAQIQIAPKNNYEKKREVRLELQAIPGFRLWNNQVAMIPLETKDYLVCTFFKDKVELMERLGVIVDITGVENSNYVPAADVHIPFEINTTLSTAVKGVHYSIESDVSEFVILGGNTKDTVYFDFLALEPDMDVIVLDLKPDGGNLKGDYVRTNIKVMGPPRFNKLVGKWTFSQVTTYDWIAMLTSEEYPDDVRNFPLNNLPTDMLEFISGETDMLKMHVTGDLTKYFRDCKVTFLREESTYLWDTWETEMIPYYSVSKANISFSDKVINERSAKVGFRVIENGKVLEVSILDYIPMDFLTGAYNMYETGGGDFGGMFAIRYHFNKVE